MIVPEYEGTLPEDWLANNRVSDLTDREAHCKPTATYNQPLNLDTILIFYTSLSHFDILHTLYSSLSMKLPLPVKNVEL